MFSAFYLVGYFRFFLEPQKILIPSNENSRQFIDKDFKHLLIFFVPVTESSVRHDQ